MRVVDIFEMIQVQKYQPDLVVVAMRHLQGMLQPGVEKKTIGQIGE